eukprot:5586754-Amphidinium_carterae.1
MAGKCSFGGTILKGSQQLKSHAYGRTCPCTQTYFVSCLAVKNALNVAQLRTIKMSRKHCNRKGLPTLGTS